MGYIVGTWRKLKVGEICNTRDLGAEHGDTFEQPFKVVRVATYEEWVDYLSGFDFKAGELALMVRRIEQDKYYFYEIEVVES